MGTPVAFHWRIFIFIEQQDSLDEYSYLHTKIVSSWILIIAFFNTIIRWSSRHYHHDTMMMMINTMYVSSIQLGIIIYLFHHLYHYHLANDDDDDIRYEWSLHIKDFVHFSLQIEKNYKRRLHHGHLN